MANLIILDTGLDYLYPDGVPLFEVELTISDLYKKIARISSLAVQADPWFDKRTKAQKLFSELHGESERIANDFLKEGAGDILPIFQALQRWMSSEIVSNPAVLAQDLAGYLGGDIEFVAPIVRFEFDSTFNLGKIIYRWQNMDTRLAEQKDNYTSETLIDKRIDTKIVENVEKYLIEALKDYVLRELYSAIGYEKKYMDYARKYEQNRQYVAYWVKHDTSRQTQYHYAGV